MKKIVILGCENSHANMFLNFLKDNKEAYKDVEVLGVQSSEKDAQAKLAKDFDIKELGECGEYKEDVDGVIITGRDGKFHMSLLRPYIKKGLVLFMDKPITCDDEETIELARVAKEYNFKLVGGSSLIYDHRVLAAKKHVEENGSQGGLIKAPVSMANNYGNFYFYSEHLVDMVLTVFGYNPVSVSAKEYDKALNVVIKYDNFEVLGIYGKDDYTYAVAVSSSGKDYLSTVSLDDTTCFIDHCKEYFDLLLGNVSQPLTINQFIVSGFLLTAIKRSLENNGKEELVRRFDVNE